MIDAYSKRINLLCNFGKGLKISILHECDIKPVLEEIEKKELEKEKQKNTIKGYKDMFFGMSDSQARNTKVYKDGVFLFGATREISFNLNANSKKVETISILMEFQSQLHENIMKLLEEKYGLIYAPTQQELDNFINGSRTTVTWIYGDGLVTLQVAFNNLMSIEYHNAKLGKAIMQAIKNLTQQRNTKTTVDDL